MPHVIPQHASASSGPGNQLQWAAYQDLAQPSKPNATFYASKRGVNAHLPNLFTVALDSCKRQRGTAPAATGLTGTPVGGDAEW